MDFQKVIIDLLGIQDIEIQDVEINNKSHKVMLVLRQKRSECVCSRCGLEFDSVIEWVKKEITAPPVGIFCDVKIIFYQLRGNCISCNRSEMAEAKWVHPEFTHINTNDLFYCVTP